MGSTTSKKAVQQGDRETNTLTQNPNSFVEKSSGFHLVEIHAPSVGYSTTVILVVLALVATAFVLYRRYIKKQEQRRILTAYYRRSQNVPFSTAIVPQAIPMRRPPTWAPPPPPTGRFYQAASTQPPRGRNFSRHSCPTCSETEA